MAPQLGKRFLGERARALATMYLTRRRDVVVGPGDPEIGIGLRARIVKRGEPAPRQLDVVLRAATAPVTPEHADKVLAPTMKRLARFRQFPYPTCLFYFTMANNEGFFTWVAEPLVTEEGRPVLQLSEEARCAKLTPGVVDGIIEQVDRWYDVYYAAMTRQVGRRTMGDGLQVLFGIIDGEAEFVQEHGHPPKVVKIPVLKAYDLAKLGRDRLGDLAEKILKQGVRALEKEKLFGMTVELVPDADEIAFE